MHEDDDDRELLARLRRVAQVADPVPADVLELGRAAFDWRTLDAELAALVLDSAEPSAAGGAWLVRSDGRARLLTFEASDLTIEIECADRRLVGQLLPPRAAEIVVQHTGGEIHAAADADGRFALAAVPAGPVRLCVTATGHTPVQTPWSSGISSGPSRS